MSRFFVHGRLKSSDFATCLTPTFDPVVPGLAVTPAQMAIATANGLPISSSILGSDIIYEDITSSVDPTYKRGMTREGLWNLSEDSKKKISRANYKSLKDD